MPIIARTKRFWQVNKPTLSPNLSVLQVEQSGMKRLLIGVGCQIQALRAVENNWVRKALRLGTPRQRYAWAAKIPGDNQISRNSGALQFMKTRFTSNTRMVLWLYLSLDWRRTSLRMFLSCMSCFDYVNSCRFGCGLHALAGSGLWCANGRKCWTWCKTSSQPVISKAHATQRNKAFPYDKAVTLPMWQLSSWVWWLKNWPQGLEYARFNRLPLHPQLSARHHPEKLDAHVPEFAKRIVSQYRLPQS